jgi:hypothetical protein
MIGNAPGFCNGDGIAARVSAAPEPLVPPLGIAHRFERMGYDDLLAFKSQTGSLPRTSAL